MTKVEIARRHGEAIPEGWAIDATGERGSSASELLARAARRVDSRSR